MCVSISTDQNNLSNFISSASDRKRRKNKNKQLYNTTQRKASTDFRTYSLNPICQITSISTVRQIEQACHKIYKDNRESLNKRLLAESYFMRNIPTPTHVCAIVMVSVRVRHSQLLGLRDDDNSVHGTTSHSTPQLYRSP